VLSITTKERDDKKPHTRHNRISAVGEKNSRFLQGLLANNHKKLRVGSESGCWCLY